nr:unnamed protein product [Callosobruchus analis]
MEMPHMEKGQGFGKEQETTEEVSFQANCSCRQVYLQVVWSSSLPKDQGHCPLRYRNWKVRDLRQETG